jgi:hypothetical protein
LIKKKVNRIRIIFKIVKTKEKSLYIYIKSKKINKLKNIKEKYKGDLFDPKYN